MTNQECLSIMVDHLKSEGLPMDRNPKAKVKIAVAMALEDGLVVIVKCSDGTYYVPALDRGKLIWVHAMFSPGQEFEPNQRVFQVRIAEVRMCQEGTSTVQ